VLATASLRHQPVGARYFPEVRRCSY